MDKELYEKMLEAVTSAKMCLQDARVAKRMKDRADALDCMEHDLHFLATNLPTLQDACCDDDGELKEIKG